MQLIKTHGSRNEIFVVPSPEFASDASLRAFVRRVCDRSAWTGGGDGVYFCDTDTAQTQAAFYNPDGSYAELCGNGMRALGRYVLDLRGTQTEVIASGGRSYLVRRGETASGVRQVTVELPPVDFADAPPPAPFGRFTAVSVPNPHVVWVVDKYVESELSGFGERAAEAFPEGANVSFLVEMSQAEVFVRTYERGAGLTPSCGSGAAASRAVYSRLGLADPGERILVRNAGGVATASIGIRDGRWFPTLEGNATVIYRAEAGPSGEELSAPEFAPEEEAAYNALADSNAQRLTASGIHPAFLS